MKKVVLVAAMGLSALGCGEKKEEKKEGFEMSRTKSTTATESKSEGVPIDMNNKGVGPITELTFPEEIDVEMATRGEAKYQAICTACHLPNQRMIGPAMAGVYERRSPEWVMNMILNPDGMLREDPIAQALLKEYNNAIMLNQNLTQEEARDIAEYLRTL